MLLFVLLAEEDAFVPLATGGKDKALLGGLPGLVQGRHYLMVHVDWRALLVGYIYAGFSLPALTH
jgi:hypothetical protein